MTGLETNIFPVLDLDKLSARYRLYRIRGLLPDQPEYFQNVQALVRRMSYLLRTPAAVVQRADGPHLAVRDDASEPPSPIPLVRATVYLDPLQETFPLDFAHRSPDNDLLCLRFLQFMLQAPLLATQSLWQPGSGQPFFGRTPAETIDSMDRFIGFAVRAVVSPDGGLGLCVDLRTKFVGARPLPVRLTRDSFRTWKKRHYIYRYGHQWYEIRADELSDLNVTEQLVPHDGRQIPLLEFISLQSRKPLPDDLVQLPHDAAVIHYFNNQGQTRAAPAGLCYPIFDTQSKEVQRSQSKMTPPPHVRRDHIHAFSRQHLCTLRFGQAALRVSDTPLQIPQQLFSIPDLEFGGSRVLSVRGTSGAQQVSVDAVGRTRATLLQDRAAGFFVTDPLDRQYLLLPRSVVDSFGPQFINDLRAAVDTLFPQEHDYDPIVVAYEDRGPRTFLDQGKAIVSAARENCRKPGYALVMVHETRKQRLRDQDQLAALTIRELRKLDLCAAVSHATVPQQAYEFRRDNSGEPVYRVRPDSRSKYAGYLRNLALNKILLTNERWPFVLASPLNADLVIGIDVKANTAGFTIVANRGRHIRTICSPSNQRERLLPDQVRKHLVELIAAEATATSPTVCHIVIHRDGRVFQSELEGIRRALSQLKREMVLSSDAAVTVVEIAKSSLIPLRLFEVTSHTGGRFRVENPQVGSYFAVTKKEGYVCTTGRAFPRRGTVQPLHVRHVEGPLGITQCMEDIYSFTALAWTRPEDCTRYPITLKLTDRRLGEDAGIYDEDAFVFEEADSALTEDVVR